MHTVVETPVFQDDAAKIMSEEEKSDFIEHLSRHPQKGSLIRGTGGLRKIRWGLQGSGKSGGARIIYYYHDEEVPIFLITAYKKSARASLSKAEKSQIKGLGKRLASAYGK